MRRRATLVVLLALGSSAAACSTDRPVGDAPSASPGSSAMASPSTSALPSPSASVDVPDPLAQKPPRYRVFHVFPSDTTVFGEGKKLIACSSYCADDLDTPRSARTWLVDANGVVEDASLLPARAGREKRRWKLWGEHPAHYALTSRGHEETEIEIAYRYLGPGPGNRYAPIRIPFSRGSRVPASSSGWTLPKRPPRAWARSA